MHHVCARTEAGKVVCWGAGDEGALGDGAGGANIGDDDSLDALLPVEVGEDVLSMAAGWNFNCVVTISGAVGCWALDWIRASVRDW